MTLPVNANPKGVPVRCARCLVHNRGLCRHASDVAIVELNRISRIRKYAAGEVILAQGDGAGIVGNVVDGVLKIAKTLPDGREHVVGLLFPTDFFGRTYTEENADFSIEAATDASVCIMERRAFEALVESHKELEHELLLATFADLDAAREWMVLLGCQNAPEKVASFFLMLLKRAGKHCQRGLPSEKGPVVAFPINRRDIAAYLGTTIETLSRQIQYLARKRIVRILDAKHFEIIDQNRLIEFSGHDLQD